MSSSHIPEREIAERPAGYGGPNLSPVGLELVPDELTPGVWALIANLPPKDNNGLVAGRDALLVIDAGITPDVSAMIQRVAAGLSDRPLRYLVNTTYHGDHTFGNAAFPADVVIVSSAANKANMTDLAYEKATRSANMYGDAALLDAVTSWRLPDLTFGGRAEIDLGGRVVELHHFGPGNGPGDTIVYVPDARTAWTGNFLCHAGTAHMLLQGGPEPYLASLRAMREALPELETIVPGHGPAGDGPAAVADLIGYLERLHEEVAASVKAGHGLEETFAACTDPWAERLDPRLSAALARYPVPQEPARRGMLALCRDLHRLNVLATYRLYAPADAG
ncbi:MBL fold metallo-hydrolase [Actinomadura sp. ATCC 31491]|uniref:MBL fold metallo-hydrolase n=1 Tax=Actinomadura luzonensis TaxID=2805427 RepID=A0ABT0G1T1_9ACTN|nr:MBL fold metallo-hydrolase [Actinomadura luzonensis]MCK2218530.1 MBL fold metallo-hydrolase [Actinomadura luzonensis]